MIKFAIATVCLLLAGTFDSSAQTRRVSPGAASYQQEASNPHRHKVGRKLYENDLFTLHEPVTGPLCTRNRATVMQLFKVGPDFRIEDGAGYRQRFESQVLPVVLAHCSVPRIAVWHYVEGVRFGKPNAQPRREYGPGEELTGVELPLSNMLVEMNGSSVRSYSPDITTASVTEARAKLEVDRRTHDAAVAQNNEAVEFGKTQEREQANRTRSSDGKLNVAGLAEKDIYLQIYDGRFIELSRLGNNEYIPSLMFTGVIEGYGTLCRKALSPKAVPVHIVATRFVGSEFAPFLQTDYYEEYLAGTVYMEPKYVVAYSTSPRNFLAKAVQHYVRQRGEDPMAFYLYLSTRAIGLAKASRKIISDNGCNSPVTLRFVDNLHRFVSGQWETRAADGYQFSDQEMSWGTKRYYSKVPRTFSPQFPSPSGKNRWEVILNEGHENQGLRWVQIRPLTSLPWTNRNLQAPPLIEAAAEEGKYLVAVCTYRHQNYQADLVFWNAKGPLPPQMVQEAAKDVIRQSRSECPLTYTER